MYRCSHIKIEQCIKRQSEEKDPTGHWGAHKSCSHWSLLKEGQGLPK